MRIGSIVFALLLWITPATAIVNVGSTRHSSGVHYQRSYSRGSYRSRSLGSSSRRNSYSPRSVRRSSAHISSGGYRVHSYRPRATPVYSSRERDSHGRIKRSTAAKDAFKHQNPCPSTGRRTGACPGYVIDHVRPLANGGRDDPSNMQWQTKEAAKEKDKWERKQ